MPFPLPLASVLTGATPAQLRGWRERGLVVPEVKAYRPPMYSFRDLVLLRSLVRLRSETSLQKISTAFRNLNVLDLTEHPSRYRFGTDGTTIFVEIDGAVLDLVRNVGQRDLFTSEEITEAFTNFRGADVPDLLHPGQHVEVRYQRLGGWPTIENTRVPYDVIARLVDFKTVHPEDVPGIYPTVTPEAARGAVAFDRTIRAVAAA